MEFVETTISEHIYNQGLIEGEARGKAKGEARGKAKGEARGEAKGEVRGEITLLENLYRQGILSNEQFEKMVKPLRDKLEQIQKLYNY
ncbi:MAG: hypothetical protein HQK79_09345 [Desulfobacterales bacterium]|nr:hypothetical protein [Desulfobacterales bacterium]